MRVQHSRSIINRIDRHKPIMILNEGRFESTLPHRRRPRAGNGGPASLPSLRYRRQFALPALSGTTCLDGLHPDAIESRPPRRVARHAVRAALLVGPPVHSPDTWTDRSDPPSPTLVILALADRQPSMNCRAIPERHARPRSVRDSVRRDYDIVDHATTALVDELRWPRSNAHASPRYSFSSLSSQLPPCMQPGRCTRSISRGIRPSCSTRGPAHHRDPLSLPARRPGYIAARTGDGDDN